MNKSRIITFLLLLTVAFACERRPLVEIFNTHYVRIYLDENLLNVTEGFYNPDHERPEYESPAVIRVALTDKETGNVVADRYLRNQGEDERGHYYDGYIVANPGIYNLMAYNFDTESSVMTETGNHYKIKSSTIEIASHLYTRIPSRVKGPNMNETIVYEPDIVFAVDCGDVVVPYVEELDTLWTPSGEFFCGKSIVKSYYLQIRVKGMQYVNSSVALLNGMAGSVNIHQYAIDNEDEVTLYFETKKSHLTTEDDETILYATFNTFGKIPGKDTELEITFDFLTTYGSHCSEKINITEKFEDEDAIERQWIIIDKVITIPEPPEGSTDDGNGGFKPNVGPWEDIQTDIKI